MQILDEESIFHQAIEIENESDRNEFLNKACFNDVDAKRRLCDLVNMHFRNGHILDETRDCGLLTARAADVPDVGSKIGPYKLLQQIGEGGMGIVFMAQQTEPVKRKVALKVIKIGMDTRRVVARFESERQAMAMMDHPCITKIHDAGATASGRPFFVMELVRGKAITKYCDEHRLSLRQRLQIFVQVCGALEHAHQKGIIHRDIKPNNIMVTNHDGRPTPKIIDFGIAKAVNDPLTDKTLFTKYGEMVGTPLYMSPEQSELCEPDVDTRTDIYSLGVLLYELITGTTPFHSLKQKSYHDICEAIRSTEPQLASTRISQLGDTVDQISNDRGTDVRSLQRFVRGELDWILMKCLARDRSQRYQSAGELAREIERYLHGELVEAAAPTWRYRAQKFAVKHKAGVGVAAAFATLLFATTLFSSVMAIKANDAHELANSRLKLVEEQRDRALAAERELAELERTQRNRVALLQGASDHNARQLKRLILKPRSAGDGAVGAITRPAFQVKPMGSYWKTSTNSFSENEVATAVTVRSPMQMNFKGATNQRMTGLNQLNQAELNSLNHVAVNTQGNSSPQGTWTFCQDQESANIEVIVVAGEQECEESLLKSILANQRKAFGHRDVIVARTLQQLGELTSGEQNWKESEQYFREALEILKESGPDKRQLDQIRAKLVNALEQQGRLQKVVDEFKELKHDFEHSEIHDEVTGFLKNMKLKIGDSDRDSESKPNQPHD